MLLTFFNLLRKSGQAALTDDALTYKGIPLSYHGITLTYHPSSHENALLLESGNFVLLEKDSKVLIEY